ncbi:MAG: alpha/beta fold hydrolase, partial [Acidimicrobiia bacterium]|nr:alpha/beta fold hydrolase [Acidimicrobiia bacterium]
MRVRTIAGLLAGGWAAWRLLGPETGPRYSPGQVRPLRVPGRSVFVGEKEFFVREAGPVDGPPLVLVHGWGFDGEMTFHRIVEPLAENFRVIIPDHRNHGKSDWIRGRYDVSDLADELAGVLDAIGVTRATFFGYSLGGLIVQEVARRHAARVERMILGATGALPVHRFRPLARVGMWGARSVARFSTQEIAAVSSRLMLRVGALDRENLRWMRAALLRRDPTLFYEAGHAAWRFESRSWLGKLAQPAMVVLTGRDQ